MPVSRPHARVIAALQAYMDCQSLRTAYFGRTNVEIVGSNAFKSNRQLREVSFRGSRVTYIAQEAFKYAYRLTYIDFSGVSSAFSITYNPAIFRRWRVNPVDGRHVALEPFFASGGSDACNIALLAAFATRSAVCDCTGGFTSLAACPTVAPTASPISSTPTVSPTSSAPTVSPTSSAPTVVPSSSVPTVTPTMLPTTAVPTAVPTTPIPTGAPTATPTTPPKSSSSSDGGSVSSTGMLVGILIGAVGVAAVLVWVSIKRRGKEPAASDRSTEFRSQVNPVYDGPGDGTDGYLEVDGTTVTK